MGGPALIVVTLAGDLDDDAELAVAKAVEDLAHDLDATEILVGGNVLVSETFATASENDLLRGEAIALPIAIVVMVLLARRTRRGRHAVARRIRRRHPDARGARRRDAAR